MLASAGSYFGTVVTMPLSAYLAETLGWRSVFWFFGKTHTITSLLWCLTGNFRCCGLNLVRFMATDCSRFAGKRLQNYRTGTELHRNIFGTRAKTQREHDYTLEVHSTV